ncbi:T9SS C-terminal target domain-containing protein [Aureibaculum marinum]|uniref:T9SS C-terminal target domain-containing protein n=1 Tax=Aureibaculum marinum TaxID=2487930 RepID=A0A3N4NSP4_9FLAO|nr:T9SS type A sorting domain-containing protein [Aureibaculum marinum]RPD94599.1 T9SS C-terminal target domain-containing protein [Aureibaculum marinum]
MGIRQLTGFLLLVPVVIFAANNNKHHNFKKAMFFISNDTVPVKKTDPKLTHLEKRALKIFPNPVKDILIIGTLSSKSNAVNKVHIFNNLGELIYQNSSIIAEHNQIKINTENLKPGVYYLKVNNGSISKFIKV